MAGDKSTESVDGKKSPKQDTEASTNSVAQASTSPDSTVGLASSSIPAVVPSNSSNSTASRPGSSPNQSGINDQKDMGMRCPPSRSIVSSYGTRSEFTTDMRLPKPLTEYRSKSTFGHQTLSNRLTEPSCRFGTGDRINLAKLYIDKDITKAIPGNNSPGPIYDAQFTLGKWCAPIVGFPKARRFDKNRRARVPGPGAYECLSSIGEQVLSCQKSPERAKFGSHTREQDLKMEKARHFSPGPVVCDESSSIGNQIQSMKKTAPHAPFGSEKRFKYGTGRNVTTVPGMGQYESIGAVGKQPESGKPTFPSFSLGSANRHNREKMFISTEHTKEHFLEASPGPAGNLRATSSLGFQTSSRKSTASSVKFGSAARFKSTVDDKPGPGTYEI